MSPGSGFVTRYVMYDVHTYLLRKNRNRSTTVKPSIIKLYSQLQLRTSTECIAIAVKHVTIRSGMPVKKWHTSNRQRRDLNNEKLYHEFTRKAANSSQVVYILD